MVVATGEYNAAVAVAPEPEPEPEPPPDPNPWRHTFTFSTNAANGKRSDVNLSAKYGAKRRVDLLSTNFDLSWAYARTGNQTTVNRLSSNLRFQWAAEPAVDETFRSRLDYYMRFTGDYAEFLAWDQRVTGDLGLGIKIINDAYDDPEGFWETLDASLQAGFGFRQEYGSSNGDFVPEGVLGLRANMKISDGQRANANITFYPDLQEWEEYRVTANLNWSIDVDDVEGLKFNLGMEYQLQSNVPAGQADYLLLITAGLRYDW